MKRCVLVVVGRQGSGKSVLTRQFLDQVPRSIAIDTHGEYGGVEINDPWSLAAYLNSRGAGPFKIAYRDKGVGDIPLASVFKMLQRIRDSWIALEEASRWLSATSSDEDVHWFLQYGRHNAISVLAVARRPFELSRLTTAQADIVVSFGMHEPRDLDWVRQVGGEEARRRVEALGEHEWDYVLNNHPDCAAILNRISQPSGEKETENGRDRDLEHRSSDHPDSGDGSILADSATDREGRDGLEDRSKGGGHSGDDSRGAPDSADATDRI